MVKTNPKTNEIKNIFLLSRLKINFTHTFTFIPPAQFYWYYYQNFLCVYKKLSEIVNPKVVK